MSTATGGGAGEPARMSEDDRARLRSILTTAQSGDMSRATAMAEAAFADGLRHPLLYNLVALKLENEGRLDDAVALLHTALQSTPRDVSLMNALGLCLNRLDRWPEALALFDAIIGIDASFAPAHCSRGVSLEALGLLPRAEASYRRALELQPGNLAALAGMASLCSRRGEHEEARRFAERVLQAEPNYPDATQVVAAADLAAGAADQAEARMRSLLADPRPSPIERAIARGFLGDALAAQGRTAEAFAAYTTCNEDRRRIYASRFADRPSTLDAVRWATAVVASARPGKPGRPAYDPADSSGVREHVFLLGFPRSGTTLLEQVLASHPDVETLDERETLIDAVRTFMRSPEDLERFLVAGEDELRGSREQYWLRVRETGAQVAGRIFIDKHPLNTLKLPLIARLFPRAKILFASRDPRDVVLSCFRRRFSMSAPIYELLTLQGAAALYDGAMRLAERVDAVLQVDRRIVRHEGLVADFEAEARAICVFVGTNWTDAMRDFAHRIRDNTSATPSAAQLARGLTDEGIGQWRRYASHLAPVLPVLKPWVQHFGYAPD